MIPNINSERLRLSAIMASNIVRLVSKQRQHHRHPPPPAPILPPPPPPELNRTPLPTLTLSSSPATQSQLACFLRTHLKPSFSPNDLLSFLKNHLHHHPRFTHLDFHVFNYASSIDSFRHDHSTFEWMARTLAISHRLDSLRALLEFMVSHPCPCSDGIFSCPRNEPIFRFSINSYCKVGRFDDALFGFDNMRKLIDGKPDVALYNIMIHGFVKHRKLDKALDFYNAMINDRVKPDVFTFNILISGHCKNSQFSLALKTFKEMRLKGCVPNVVSFNSLIKGFFREKKFEEGIRMVNEMIELGCEMSKVTCEILVDGLCEEGRAWEASDLLIDFSRRGVLCGGFDCYVLIEYLCAKKNVVRAKEVLDELWARGNFPSSIACAYLIEGLRMLGNTDAAYQTLKRMLTEGIMPDIVTFNCVLSDMCDARRTEEANKLKLLADSKGLNLDGTTYYILVSGFTKELKRKEGEILVNEMLDDGYIPDIATYNRLMDGLASGQVAIR